MGLREWRDGQIEKLYEKRIKQKIAKPVELSEFVHYAITDIITGVHMAQLDDKGSLGITVVLPHMGCPMRKGGSLQDQDKCVETSAGC